MSEREHHPLPEVLREMGEQLEAEYRAAGVQIPPGMTPEELARSVFDFMRGELDPDFKRAAEEVRATLGPDASEEVFYARLRDLLDKLQRPKGPGPAASA
jgi:hypothetical protein